jgi:hypothetical protein
VWDEHCGSTFAVFYGFGADAAAEGAFPDGFFGGGAGAKEEFVLFAVDFQNEFECELGGVALQSCED